MPKKRGVTACCFKKDEQLPNLVPDLIIIIVFVEAYNVTLSKDLNIEGFASRNVLQYFAW